jgi:N-acetylglutamate synthase-like GNAT family acetyltransferase
VHNGKPVSCLSVFMLDASVCQIRKFATLKTYQRQGFGRFLFQSVLEKMAEAGVHEVCLDARIGAVNFYTKFGFRPEGEHFFKKGWSTCEWRGGKFPGGGCFPHPNPLPNGAREPIARAAGWPPSPFRERAG